MFVFPRIFPGYPSMTDKKKKKKGYTNTEGHLIHVSVKQEH